MADAEARKLQQWVVKHLHSMGFEDDGQVAKYLLSLTTAQDVRFFADALYSFYCHVARLYSKLITASARADVGLCVGNRSDALQDILGAEDQTTLQKQDQFVKHLVAKVAFLTPFRTGTLVSLSTTLHSDSTASHHYLRCLR